MGAPQEDALGILTSTGGSFACTTLETDQIDKEKIQSLMDGCATTLVQPLEPIILMQQDCLETG